LINTNVYLRNEDKEEKVKITNINKPRISSEAVTKWQRILNLMAKIVEVPAGLIMNITEESMVVFLKSQNKENPYPEGGSDTLGHGLYCETVIGKDKELLVEDALKSMKWKDNPDVKLNMISYYGLPIKWPDEEFFGTICVLDSKANNYSDEYKELIKEFKLVIEDDLKMLLYQDKLKYYSETDILTSVYNRRKLEKTLKNEFKRSKRTKSIFSISIMDINKLKYINDNYGHNEGDTIIKTFSGVFKNRIRTTDYFGRWGGDEFLLICPDTEENDIEKLMQDIEKIVVKELNEVGKNFGFCYGCSQFSYEDERFEDTLKRADEKLYECKSNLK